MANFRTLDLNLLRVLDALLSEGSTVAAGRKIGLSQPAVSAALGRLRSALGDPLFVRSGTGLEPTDYAKSTAAPLADALAGLQDILEPLKFDPAQAQQDFVFTSSDYLGILLLPRLYSLIAAEAPGIRLQMLESPPDRFGATIDGGGADFVLSPDMFLPDHLERDLLFATRAVAVSRAGNRRLATAGIGPNDKIPLDLFCDLPQVLYAPTGDFHGLADESLAKLGRERRVTMTVSAFSGVLHTVDRTDLIGIVPMQFAMDQADRLDLVTHPLPFDMPPMRLMLGWHPRTSNNPGHLWMRKQIMTALAGTRATAE